MGVILASLIISVLGEAARYSAESYKYDKQIEADELKTIVSNALNQARNQGQAKLEELSSKLLGLDFINRSPVVKDIINRKRKELNNIKKDLRQDLDELDKVELSENMKRDAVYDANFFKIDSKLEDYKKENENNVQKIQEIASQIEQRL